MSVYVVTEQIHNAHRVVMVTKSLKTCSKVIRREYKMDREDWLQFLAWKEYYNIISDTKIRIEELEMGKYKKI